MTVSQGVQRPYRWRDPQVLDDGSVVVTGESYSTWPRQRRHGVALGPRHALVTRVASSTERAELAGVSRDGRWRAWWDHSTRLVTDATTGAPTRRCHLQSFGALGDATSSADGSRLVVDGFGAPVVGEGFGARLGRHFDRRTGQGGAPTHPCPRPATPPPRPSPTSLSQPTAAPSST
ncbi:MAG: hypothetical protein ABIQ15_01125 [Nocardioides sp.]